MILTACAAPPKLGIEIRGNKFYRNNKPYRACGINHFSLVWNTGTDMLVGGRRDGSTDIADIKSFGIPFIRTAVGGFDRPSWQWLFNNRELFFTTYLDPIVAKCEAAGVGLIPVLVWDTKSFCDLSYYRYGTHEGPAKLADPNSNVRAMMMDWISAVVSRYRSSPAILAWSAFNECSDKTGPEYYKFWAPDGSLFSWLDWGTKPGGGTYSSSDFLSFNGWVSFSFAVRDAIRKADGYGRFVSAGSALGPSYAVTAQTTNSYAADTKAQWDNAIDGMPWVVARDQAFGCVVSHIYPQDVVNGTIFYGDVKLTNAGLIQAHKQWADSRGVPFFLEEFGASMYGDTAVDHSSRDPASELANITAAINAIESNDVMLSAIWNYDGRFDAQAIAWQVFALNPAATARRYQMEMVAALNQRLAAKP